MIMMWLGEQITDKGIGNGISLIITVGIVARLPAAQTPPFRPPTPSHSVITTEFPLDSAAKRP